MDKQFLDNFERLLSSAEEKLIAMTETQSETPRTHDKWCPKEIIGHLIDSASNNHQRFIRAQFKDDLLFEGYWQEDWVNAQQYKQEEWKHLVMLWKLYNLHLMHAVSHIPDTVLKSERTKHNLDEIAFKPIPKEKPVTLEYFIIDYVDHLKHHLRQILSDM